jgi:GT2 family glycosyltransferase
VDRSTKLSALVVNYQSGAFAVRCVESLRACWSAEGRDPERLEVIVVDNASPTDQTPWLDELVAAGAHVIRHDENAGYAGGMNLAYAASSGGPRDVVAILNPDLVFLPGAIGTLIDHLLENDDVGAVDPRACIDPLGVLNLPRNPLPTLTDHLRVVLAQTSPGWCRSYSRRRVEDALPWWRADGPIESDMLSGCCVLLRREVAGRLPTAPALMDERYPLYYEDTDLFRSIRALGLKLVHHGGARIIHHWSRSAGVAGQFEGEPLRRYHVSQREYFAKWYGRAGTATVEALNGFAASWPPELSFRPMHPITPLGDFEGPVSLPVGRDGEYLVELGMAPTWMLAVGILASGETWTCPADTWEWFFQADYFMRAIDIETGEFLGAWSFRKVVPGREEPLSVDEVRALSGATEVPA